MGNDEVVRKSPGSGRWFPESTAALKKMINSYLDKAGPQTVKGSLVGCIAPHAGFIYSGPVAGYTFRAISDHIKAGHKVETIVILGFSHSKSFSGVALMDGKAISTPLGTMAIDMEGARYLQSKSSRINFSYSPHNGEHSAENQIPFAQTVLPNGKIIVALIGDHKQETINELAAALFSLSKKQKILVVSSTDLLHDPNYDKVTKTDHETLDKISKLDTEKLMGSWSYAKQVCCGIAPVLTVMKYAKLRGVKKVQPFTTEIVEMTIQIAGEVGL